MATDSPRSRGRARRPLADSPPRGTGAVPHPDELRLTKITEPLAALSTRIPASLLKRAKLAAIEAEEDLQDLIARAVQRELQDPSG